MASLHGLCSLHVRALVPHLGCQQAAGSQTWGVSPGAPYLAQVSSLPHPQLPLPCAQDSPPPSAPADLALLCPGLCSKEPVLPGEGSPGNLVPSELKSGSRPGGDGRLDGRRALRSAQATAGDPS